MCEGRSTRKWNGTLRRHRTTQIQTAKNKIETLKFDEVQENRNRLVVVTCGY